MRKEAEANRRRKERDLKWGGGSKTKEISMKNIDVKVLITNRIT